MGVEYLYHQENGRNLWYVIPGQGPAFILSHKFSKESVVDFVWSLVKKSAGPTSYRIQQNVAFFLKDKVIPKRGNDAFNLDFGDKVLYSPSSSFFVPAEIVTPYIIELGDNTTESAGLGIISLKKCGDIIEIHCTPYGKDGSGRDILSFGK